MNKILWLSLLLSLLWHSSACILFKIAEPYASRDKKVQIFDVAFLPLDTIDVKAAFEERFSYNNTEFINSRFTLPSEADHSLQAPEIKVDFEKKIDPADVVSAEMLGLVQYRNNQDAGDAGAFLHSDDYILKLNDVDYQPVTQFGNQLEEHIQPKTLEFMIKGDMLPVDTTAFANLSDYVVAQPCVLRFSVDRFGTVRYAIIEQSSGNTVIDSKLLSVLRQCTFALPGKQSVTQDAIAHYTMWGKIIFYNQ